MRASAPTAPELLDRYILAKTRALIDAVEGRMDDYDLPGAAMEIQAFIDALNNWYIRRSAATGSGGRASRSGADVDRVSTRSTRCS